jgi:hypothetical protein
MSPPTPGFGLTSDAGGHTHDNWRLFDLTMNFAHGDPEAPWYVPIWSDPSPYNPALIEGQPGGYNAYTAAVLDHQHIMPPTEYVLNHNHSGNTGYETPSDATASHSHTGSSDTVSNHNHSITLPAGSVTADATVATHTHTVDKTTGWDSETKPDGIWMNFIIKR